jgi:sporulation protein YlmC with PRC-barrel domain
VTHEERIRELEDRYDGFEVYAGDGERLGRVDDLFIDEDDREEYVGVRLGLLGMKSTLIPMEVVRVDEAEKRLEVSGTKERIHDAPSFGEDAEITPEDERRIRAHFDLEIAPDTGDQDPGERETRETPLNRRVEESETVEERGGNARVRRRVRREEVSVYEEDPDRPGR